MELVKLKNKKTGDFRKHVHLLSFDRIAVSEKQVIKEISVVFSFFFSMGGAQINVLKSQKKLEVSHKR